MAHGNSLRLCEGYFQQDGIVPLAHTFEVGTIAMFLKRLKRL